MTRLLHSLALPDGSLDKPRGNQRRRLAAQGLLQSDTGDVEGISLEPGEQQLRGAVAGALAGVKAQEIEQLFASGIEVVPYAAVDGTDPQRDGYYTLRDVELRRGTPVDDRAQTFDGAAKKVGTPDSHYRAVRTNATGATNPFASGGPSEIGLSARADRVQWFDDVAGTVEDATVQRTVVGEHDDLHVFDIDEPSFDDPVLVYRIGLNVEWRSDCRVYDTRGEGRYYEEQQTDGATVGSSTVGSATVGGGLRIPQRQRVSVTDHQYRGAMHLETDRLRLEIPQPDASLAVYRWDADDRLYSPVQLGPSSWRLDEVDILHIGLARIKAQLGFVDGTGSSHRLNATLQRGLDDVLWTVPANESSPPSGLTDRLGPIAREDASVVVGDGDVIKREDVDR